MPFVIIEETRKKYYKECYELFKIKNILPAGACALALMSFIGAKDAGVFLTPHSTVTYSGKKIEFQVGEKAELVEDKGGAFLVAKGEARLTVPKEKILLTETNINLYQVVKNTSIRDNGKVLRSLFLGEEVKLLDDKGTYAVVVAADGTKGTVLKSAIKLISDSQMFVTNTKAKKDFKVDQKGVKLNFKKGDDLQVKDFVNDEFIILVDGKEFNVNKDFIDIKVGTNPAPVAEEAGEEVVPEKYKNKLGTTDKPAAETDGTLVANILNSAYDKLGTPYVYATAGPESYDCSGFTYAIYTGEFKIKLPRSSKDQATVGTKIEKEDLQKGDLVFFDTTRSGGVSHVGIYIGDGEFIHASSGQGKVVVSKLSEGYYSERFLNASRVLD